MTKKPAENKLLSVIEDKYPKTGKFFLQPLEPGLPDFVLTKNFPTHQLSFGYGYTEKPFKDLMLPIFMGPERYKKQPPSKRDEIFIDIKRTDDGELKLVNQEVIDSQKGILGEVIKKAMVSIFTGQGMVGMSLPVRIFEPRSTMQRIADNMVYIPNYLKRANEATNPTERAKLCITGLVSGICMSPSMQKPFNPYLGETLEAEFPDKSRVYMEHTSHHPPISNFYVDCSYGAKVSGRLEQIADVGANSMELIYRGPVNIEFSDGHKVTMFLPTGITTGVVMGSRMLKFGRKACYYDAANNIKGYFDMEGNVEHGKYKGKRADTFTGEIYKFDPKKHKGFGDNYKDIFSAFKSKDKLQQLASIVGGIFESIEFDGQEYWNFDSNPVERAVPVENPLPSDYRFREDLLWLEYKDKDRSQAWKLKLEEIQRWDRGLRQEAEKKRKKAGK